MANTTSTHAPDVRRDTILVVDDTPETLGFLTDTLDHAGFTVLIATDGESALRLDRADHAGPRAHGRGHARAQRLRDLPAHEAQQDVRRICR